MGMNQNSRKFFNIAAAAAMTVALSGLAMAQSAPQGGAAGAPAGAPAGPSSATPQGGQGGPSEGYMQGNDQAAGPAGAQRASLEVPVLYVTSVEILRTKLKPQLDIIRVHGLASSQGWSAPELVPFFYGKASDGILDLQFIATSPVQSQKADGFVPVGAIFTLDAGHPFAGVRVRAAANAITVKEVPGSAEATIKTIDCTDCVGKKFAEKGKAPAGQPGVVRAEDLPRGFRVIVPSHGVAGIVHNPNRLNLILDDNNTITEAFWE
jgi:hypothetical protein